MTPKQDEFIWEKISLSRVNNMNLGTQLVQRQSQKLVMTQDLRQSIELLALSTLELSDKIQSELLENPLLEDTSSDEKSKTPELYSKSEVRSIEKNNLLKDTESNWGDNYSIENPKFYDSEASDRNQKYIESSTVPTSLSEHLLAQLRLMDITEKEYYMAEVLVSLIDDKGFISADLEVLANEMKLQIKSVYKVQKLIQECDPIGIGANGVQETLYIQSKILYPENKILHELIKEHLSDLEKFEYKKIGKALKLTEEEVSDNAKFIKKLEPYPATLYQARKTDYIIPDVIIDQEGEEFAIFINDEWLPKLIINKEYKSFLSTKGSSEDKEFISNKLNSANWLIRSVHQRKQTLFKTVKAIIEAQKDFFIHGVSHTEPLTLKDISEKTNLSESTVSRITTNKYIQTKWGIYELKWFFSSGVKSTEGGKASSKKIHDMILEMVKQEDEANPLSDQDIVDEMEKKGIEIARRTVAKYRKILRILPSNQRKRISHFKG
jgi:RNA polymerase sigma-54 factor